VAADLLDPPEWEAKGRPKLEPHQLPPKGNDWDLWLLEAGRGAGKTEACARYFTKYMHQNPGYRGRIIAPTYDDAVESCLKGPSGLLPMDPDVRMVVQPGGTKALWPNGSEALVLGTHSPRDVDRLRAGGNRHIDWWEEMAANPQLEDAWDQAAFGLRLGDWPHSIASSTPRLVKAYKAIRSMADVVLTKASMFDNPNLPEKFKKRMLAKYEGTRLGKQELYGELLEDVPGALWSMDRIDRSRCQLADVPQLAVVVCAIDPAATAHEDSDDTGIVVAGLASNGEAYILGDYTCHLKPAGWGKRAVHSLARHEGDYVVGEVNNGGDMVEHVIYTTNRNVPFKQVRASRGKQTRAQPVAALWGYEADEEEGFSERKPRVHMVGTFTDLEDQMCTWVPGEEDSPDNMDAMVWAITELMLAVDDVEEEYEDYQPVKIGADV
jgi:phage terminase large subunit-like protein